MKCPDCGNDAPAGSLFCNQCGHRFSTDIACPKCGESIPANSVFCPKCGKMVRNDMADEPKRKPIAFDGPRESHRATSPEPVRPSRLSSNDNGDADHVRAGVPSHYNRNLLIGIGVAVALIVILQVFSKCTGSNDRHAPLVGDTTAVVPTPIGDPLETFSSELGRNNLDGDGATVGGVAHFDAEGIENPERIIGVTFRSNGESRSFYKIYQLVRNGSAWDAELLHTQYLNGRNIDMSPSALMISDGKLPRAVKVDGHDAVCFALLNNAPSASNGRVTMALYDLVDKKLTTLDYDGPVKGRDDGRQYVYGKPLQSAKSAAARLLAEEVHNVKLVYFPTEEELKAEEEERQRLEEEKALEGPENAAAKWTHDNGEKLDALKQGETVTMKAASYDKPIFNMRDKNKKIESDTYIVFSDNNGSVYGFNKKSRKYFVIYTPSGGVGSAADIGFGDDNRELRMRTADGHISYDLPSDKAHLIQ